MRNVLIAGNWKMNLTAKGSVELAKDLKGLVKDVDGTEILICPSFTALQDVYSVIKGSNIELGAQNVCYDDKGAFTGEISAEMLKETGCKYVIIGHSERRHVFKETDDMINLRVKNCLKNKSNAILCVGETLEQRESGETEKVVVSQIKKGLEGISEDDMKDVVIAYEPVWAIGTGKTASPLEAQEVHVIIRDFIKDIFNDEISFKTRILYGGSVKPDNIKELMMQSDIDGALVGGASLKAEEFAKLVKY